MIARPRSANGSARDALLGAAGLAVAVVFCCLAAGCAGSGQLGAPYPHPDDQRHIPKPKESNINIAADAFERQIADQIEQSFDLSRQLRRLFGRPKEAMNADAFGEVPNSSWFTNRNAWRRLSPKEIARGPNKGEGPDTSSVWVVFRTKAEGITPGFHIQDSRGVRYVIKFEPTGYPELPTGAEVVSTKLFYAAGYNVPENYVIYFRPQILRLEDGVKFVDKRGRKRIMTKKDLEEILRGLHPLPDGRIRALASKYIPGIPIGPFKYNGTRKDDPNDIVPHEHRRELRGLRVMAAWLNHFDTKANNTYDSYVTEADRSYVRHYLIDFGSTLGSGGKGPNTPQRGHENTVDPLEMLRSLVTFGLHVRAWEKLEGFRYNSIGLYESTLFHPQKYKFDFPNPAFENLTDLDGYWGAKLVMSFTDEQLETAVAEAHYSDQEAADYLLQTLIERRDLIGRYWFSRVAPLDRFEVTNSVRDGSVLHFRDLAVDGGVADARENFYRVIVRRPGGKGIEPVILKNLTSLKLTTIEPDELPPSGSVAQEVELRTRRGSAGRWSEPVRVHIAYRPSRRSYEVTAVMR